MLSSSLTIEFGGERAVKSTSIEPENEISTLILLFKFMIMKLSRVSNKKNDGSRKLARVSVDIEVRAAVSIGTHHMWLVL